MGKVSFAPRGEHPLLFRRMEEPTDNFTPSEKNHPWGTTSPLGVKVKNGHFSKISKFSPG
jgi:hypothetical protein